MATLPSTGDLGAHAPQLVHILKAVALPHALVDHAGTVGDGQQRGNLGLHIRGEAGMGHGLYVALAQGALAVTPARCRRPPPR